MYFLVFCLLYAFVLVWAAGVGMRRLSYTRRQRQWITTACGMVGGLAVPVGVLTLRWLPEGCFSWLLTFAGLALAVHPVASFLPAREAEAAPTKPEGEGS